MDISKTLPPVLPPHWAELEKEIRNLQKRYSLVDLVAMSYVLNRELADKTIVDDLSPIIKEFSSVDRIHVTYGDEKSVLGSFHAYIETKNADEMRAIKESASQLENYWQTERMKSLGDHLKFHWSKEDFDGNTELGAKVVVLDREST